MTFLESIRWALMESRSAYGGWLSPGGQETPVDTNAPPHMKHELTAQRILGDEWEEVLMRNQEASEVLGKRGWARLVHQPGKTMVDMDTNARLTSRQTSYLKDLGIENDVDIFLDVGAGRYIYQRGDV